MNPRPAIVMGPFFHISPLVKMAQNRHLHKLAIPFSHKRFDWKQLEQMQLQKPNATAAIAARLAHKKITLVFHF